MTVISVVIPTRNRRQALARALDCLSAQSLGTDRFEVIVVDDGSDDDTWAWLQAQVNVHPFSLRSIQQPPSGPATARNLGVDAARGDLILFLGDDILGLPNLLSSHVEGHATWPDPLTAVLGKVQWHPDLDVTSLMRWMETGGAQWRFEGLDNGDSLDYRYFITANISLKKTILIESGGFDEEFRYAALEDTELGYRLVKMGLQIRFAPDALAYHWHPTNLEGFLARSRRQGETAVHLVERWPELEQQYLDPAGWFGERQTATRHLLVYLIRWRALMVLLQHLVRPMADRPPGVLQRLASPVYWLLAYRHRLLGLVSAKVDVGLGRVGKGAQG